MTMQRLVADTRYYRLVRKFPLRPIESDEQLERAIEVLNGLLLRNDFTTDEHAYIDVLSDLIEKYEDEAIPEGPVSDVEMLAHLLEAKGVTQHDVSAATGIAESTISSLLKGRRRFNRDHVVKLAAYFHVGPGVFLSSSPSDARAGVAGVKSSRSRIRRAHHRRNRT